MFAEQEDKGPVKEQKSLSIDIRKIEGGYEVSFQLPPEVIFTQALHRGFESDGRTARVRIEFDCNRRKPESGELVDPQ